MILEFNNGDAINVFPVIAIRYDVKAGATWWNDPDQEEEFDLEYNYDGCDPIGLLDEMECRGCINIEVEAEHDGITLFFLYEDGKLTLDSSDYNSLMKKIAKDLICGLDKDLKQTMNGLEKLKDGNNMTLDELENLCWDDSATVFDLINVE